MSKEKPINYAASKVYIFIDFLLLVGLDVEGSWGIERRPLVEMDTEVERVGILLLLRLMMS